MGNNVKYLLAICIGILPFNVIMVWYRLTHEEAFTILDMLLYPPVFGGAIILLILVLNRYLLQQKLSEFNPGKGKWYLDIIIGSGLTVIFFLLMFAEQAVFTRLLPRGRPPSQEVINLIIGLANNPVLLAIWLGPVVWIGVAIFEEVQRIFFMNCL